LRLNCSVNQSFVSTVKFLLAFFYSQTIESVSSIKITTIQTARSFEMRIIDHYLQMPEIIKLGELVQRLYDRWECEKQYEEWRDYWQYGKQEVEKIGAKYVSFSKRPFELEFIWNGNLNEGDYLVAICRNKKGVFFKVKDRVPPISYWGEAEATA